MQRVFAAILGLLFATAAGAQTFSLEPQTRHVERGQSLQLVLRVRSDSVVRGFTARLSMPPGFVVVGRAPGVPRVLNPGRHSFDYLVRYPTLTSPAQRGLATGDSVPFRVDLTYIRGGQVFSDFVETRVFYTTSIAVYLLSGLAGVLLGFTIKALSGKTARKKAERTEGTPVGPRVLTIFLLGFAVLLYLAKSGMPSHGWLDSLVLGILLGIAGDDTLLGKLQAPR